MVYEPGTLRRLRLSEALYKAAFSMATHGPEYASYRPGERGAFGIFVNLTLRSLLGIKLFLNLVLMLPIFIATLAGSIVSLPLLVPYWIYRRLFVHDDNTLQAPLGLLIVLFPMHTLIWLVAAPIKFLEVIIVLVAFSLGPRSDDG